MRFPVEALLVASFALGCSSGFGLAQTAKTVEPGGARMAIGVAGAFNEYDQARGGAQLSNYSLETGFRFGVDKSTDLGVGPWLTYGLQADVKHELTPRERPYGVALRFGGGGAATEPVSWSAFGGVIGSYAFAPWITGYASGTYRNFWFVDSKSRLPPADGSQYASRKGYGDGLLQATAGLRLGSPRVALYLEYARWLPMQNDPGDFFKLVASHVFSFTLGFCLGSECRTG